MNIFENITYSQDSANTAVIKKSDKIRYFAVALGQGTVLKKHKTAVPATLLVLKGEINFVFSKRELILREGDVYEIPVDEEHEVVGILSQNLFTVTQEL